MISIPKPSFKGLITSYLLLDILLGCVIYHLGKRLRRILEMLQEKRRLLSLIPSPKAPSWLFGHLLLYKFDQVGLYKRVDVVNEFPAMFCFQVGPILTGVTIHHPDLVKVLLNSDAHKGFILKRLGEAIGKGMLSADGKSWQIKRHMLTPAFHFEMLKCYIVVFNETMKTTMQWLENKSRLNEPCNVQLPCNQLSFDNMIRCIMSQPGVKDGKDVPLISMMKDIQHYVIRRIRNPLLRSNLIYNLTPEGRKFNALVLKC